MADRPRVLFLCTGNSCRSQMAEGFARKLVGDKIEAFSAGIEQHGMNARAQRVMADADCPLTGHASKTLSQLITKLKEQEEERKDEPAEEKLDGEFFDVVVTVCDHAAETCPRAPGKKVMHRSFRDPPKLAADAKTEEEALEAYRTVRDEIRSFVLELPSLVEELLGR
jgi:arsenate reductase (thioredoxin)